MRRSSHESFGQVKAVTQARFLNSAGDGRNQILHRGCVKPHTLHSVENRLGVTVHHIILDFFSQQHGRRHRSEWK
jgi:hypothetical protein